MHLGVLALQGAFGKHSDVLSELTGASPVLVKHPSDLENLTALFLPGGETTTISKLLRKNSLIDPIAKKLKEGLAVFATCAGMILLATDIEGAEYNNANLGDDNKDSDSQTHDTVTKNSQAGLKAIDISVQRNAYGPQIESFEAELDISSVGIPSFHGVFIRSPIVSRYGKSVEVLATYKGSPVLCRQENVLAASFHPELTSDSRLHQYFLNNIVKNKKSA